MRATRAVELGTGMFVLLGFAALFFLVTQITNREIGLGDSGYRLTAGFDQIGGLKPGAPVSMSGVTVGRVESIGYDFTDYRAVVVMRIDGSYDRIPEDSDASIFTAGLLGEQYVALEAGGDDRYLKAGAEIKLTQSALVLEQIVGQFLFSKASEGVKSDAPGGAGAAGGSGWGTGSTGGAR